MRSVARTACASLLLLLSAAEARSDDLVRFRNGRSVAGRVVRETAEEIVIELTGGGRLAVPRSLVAEVVRDVPADPAEARGEVEGVLRSEHSFLWSGRRRVGARTLVVRRLAGGDLQLEEDTVFLTEDGREDVRVRLVERSGADHSPREIVYREASAAGGTMLAGTVRDDSIDLAVSLPGERRQTTLRRPPDLRFPLSLREEVVRDPRRARAAPVFDPRGETFVAVAYEPLGTRRVPWDGAATEVTVLSRRRGSRPGEEVWLDAGGRCLTEEVNGPQIVAVLSTRERVEAFLAGSQVTESGEERRVCPEFVHPEAGFRVRKPSLAWTFEPGPPGARKVLSLSSLRWFAYADFFVLPGAPAGGDDLPALAADMVRRFSAVSEGFEKQSEGCFDVGGVKAVKMTVRSRNKGEDLRSLLVGFVQGGRTWFVTLACPAAVFEEAMPDFDAILASVEFLR